MPGNPPCRSASKWQRSRRENLGSDLDPTVAETKAELTAGSLLVAMEPQTHELGAEAGVDFGEFYAWLRGEWTLLWLFVMRLSASGKAFHHVFGNQCGESFFCLPGVDGAHEKGGVDGEKGIGLIDALQNRIAPPLGLEATRFVGDTVASPENLAGGWSPDVGAVGATTSSESIMSSAWSAGAPVSTTNELRSFITALFDGELISPAALDEMACTGPAGYGLGPFVAQLGIGNPGYARDGSIPAYSSTMGISPESDDVIVICHRPRSAGDHIGPKAGLMTPGEMLHRIAQQCPCSVGRGDTTSPCCRRWIPLDTRIRSTYTESMLTESVLTKHRHIGGRSHTRAERKQQTRLQLIDAALDVMAERGITATRTIDVANRAGVAHGTVFVHFPTREDLLAAVVAAHAEQIGGRLHELAADTMTVRDVLAAHLAGLREHEAFYARLVMEGPLLPPYPRATLLGIQSAISFHLAQAAEREMAAGRIRRMPVYLLFNTWLGLIHHYLSNRELFAPGQSVVERWGPTLLDHYVGLIRPEGEGGET